MRHEYGAMISPHTAITPSVELALLKGGRIVEVYSHQGNPGGHNNDCIKLTMESGDQIILKIYSLYAIRAEVVEPQCLHEGNWEPLESGDFLCEDCEEVV